MIDLTQVSACLITKDPFYPIQALIPVLNAPFGEIIILTNSDSPHRKHELFAKAKYDYLYYQDDDCVAPVAQLAELADPEIINLAIKPAHFEAYKDKRLSMGIGWGSLFHRKFLDSLRLYTAKYGYDFLYKRETERILTYLNYPQNRLILPITDLPSAMAPDRLSMQPDHYNYIPMVEERCATLIGDIPIN